MATTKKSLEIKLTAQKAKQLKKKLFAQKVNQIDLTKVKSLADLVDNYKGMSVQARNIGACATVVESMLTDKDRPTILLGLAGPLIAGGLRKVIRDLIDLGMVDAVISTGAILYQDYYQACGYQHYMGDPNADDAVLRDLYIDRIYDTYVDEEKFWETDCAIGAIATKMKPGIYSSREFLRQLSANIKDPNSILGTAYKRGIPVFAPALNDSSIGIGLTSHYHHMVKSGKGGANGVVINSIRDNYELTQIVVKSRCTSAMYIAGGVPKNYINDSVVMSYIFDRDTGGHRYAIQLTTDVPHWGGLSGSTLDEATSWGKINRKASTSMAFVDPMVSLPLVAGYNIQKKNYAKRTRIEYKWNEDILQGIKFVARGK